MSVYPLAMPTLADVEKYLDAFPGATVGTRYGRKSWFVGTKNFAWLRPLTKSDIKKLGDQPPPDGPILGLAVEDLAEKEAVLQAGHCGVFTISHFDGYPAILVHLDQVAPRVLVQLAVDAWLACAPADLAEQHAATLGSLSLD